VAPAAAAVASRRCAVAEADRGAKVDTPNKIRDDLRLALRTGKHGA